MALKCGIVGLPNVGKSTLFNALVGSAAAQAANYPFCTIDPNVGIVAVPDPRLEKLAAIAASQKIIPTQLEFVDIAGLVAGASRGEGLGNKFLGHIREVDAIAYVVRCFEDADIIHVDGSVDPRRDAEVIELELALADLESLTSRLPSIEKKAKNDPEAAALLPLVRNIIAHLDQGKSPHSLITPDNQRQVAQLQLLSTKPFFYISNVKEEELVNGNRHSESISQLSRERNTYNTVISAKIEAEISALSSSEERDIFLAELGIQSSGLDRISQCAYATLGLSTFFTIGPKEARAWTIARNCPAPQAAGVIHSDFERGFICAEVISYDDYIAGSGEAGARSSGKLRVEGKGYQVQDGDVIHFRFNV